MFPTPAKRSRNIDAIHPESKRVRYFAPVSPLLHRSGRRARLPMSAAPARSLDLLDAAPDEIELMDQDDMKGG